ncbi:MAG TPA: glycosyltransferase [Candidatus Thermoplasmatota archaeon]|nr:glycosyltransferase [Candidatus Thermoplasmatota archaeon]
MKVLLNHLDAPGIFGMKRYTVELAEALKRRGIDVRLRPSGPREIVVVGRKVGGYITRALRNFVPVGRGDFDLVHATDHKSNPRPSAEVVTVHDLIPYENPALVAGGRIDRMLEAHAARRAILGAARLLTDTDHVRRQMLELGAAPSQVQAVHLGVRHDVFFPDPGAAAGVMRPGMLNVLVTVRTDLRKRADLVLAAAAALPFVHVVQVGGDAPHPRGADLMAAAREATARLEREGRWTRLPTVDDATLRGLLSACDVLVHPSLAEGFSLPPVEGLACGARVLASDIAVHHEVLGDAARYTRLDVPSLRQALEFLWDGDVRERGWPSRAARLAHARGFTWDRTAAATEACYASALSSL